MGMFGFLSRKSASDARDHGALLKAQAYDATVAASPPVRGARPVVGNGKNILEQFQKSHPDLATYPADDSAAPPPPIPRLRSDSVHSDTFSRPSTAASSHMSVMLGRTRASSIASSVTGAQASKAMLPPPPKKKYGPYKLPSKSPDPMRNPDVTASSPMLQPPWPAFATADRASSIRSGGSGSSRGFVDLLDAQSMLRPADFWTRVKATGSKNYGEEVADRNIGEHCNASTIAVTGSSRPRASTLSKTPAVPGAVDEDSGDNRPRQPKKRHSMGSGLRSKSSTAKIRDNFPQRTSSRVPIEPLPPHEVPQPVPDREPVSGAADKAALAARHRSLPSYVRPSSSRDRPNSSSSRIRVREADSTHFPETLRDRARAVANEADDASLGPVKANSSKKQTEPARRARDSLLQAKGRLAEQHLRHARDETEHNLPDRHVDSPTPSLRRSSRRRTLSHTPSVSETKSPSKSNRSREAPEAVRSTATRDNNQTEPSVSQIPRRPRDPASPSRRKSVIPADSHGSLHSALSGEPPQPSPVRLSPSKRRPQSINWSSHHDRNRSLVSLSNQSSVPFDIEDSIPERTSSLGRWSLTSETGGSTMSSNQFPPASAHTPNTSVDLGPVFPPAMSSPASSKYRESQSNFHVPSSPPPRSMARSRHRRPSTGFNIDDYVSDDSFEAASPNRGEYEKDLLFPDIGYGSSGFQLPGLPDGPIGATEPEPSYKSPFSSQRRTEKRTPKIPDTPFHMAAFSAGSMEPPRSRRASQRPSRSAHSSSHRPAPHVQKPSFNYSYSDDGRLDAAESSDDDELTFDIPLRRNEAPRNHPRPPRLRHGAAEAPIQEERYWGPYDHDAPPRGGDDRRPRLRESHHSLRRHKGKGKANAY
ncbi:hypothetical protein GGR56DRAFT_324552 [Xylariaceae sp. FL0804]|nr:hypothetical protein GGR56DRAFT_324552 [Xylariaceae sp. FL0804]